MEVLGSSETAVTLRITVFFSLVENYQRLGRKWRFHLQVRKEKLEAAGSSEILALRSRKCCYDLSARLRTVLQVLKNVKSEVGRQTGLACGTLAEVDWNWECEGCRGSNIQHD